MSLPIDISKAMLVSLIFAKFKFYRYYFSVTCSILLGIVAHGLETIKEALLWFVLNIFFIDCPVGCWTPSKFRMA